jgi:putative copper resistance protein D
LMLFGTAAFALLFAPLAIEDYGGDAITLWRGLAVLNLVMSPLVFMQIAAGMAQASWLEVAPFLAPILRETLAGRIWVWRLVAAVMLAIVVWIPARVMTIGACSLALTSILIVLSSATSHAIDKGALVVAIYCAHQAAAGLWLGALVSLLMSARRGPEALAAFTPRVSTVCAWAVGIMVISGPLIALRWLGWNPHLLLDSAYGRTLTVKIMIAVPVLLLGAYNRYWQVPGIAKDNIRLILVRAVSAECVLLLAVLAWSAILANTPPPH